MGILREALNDIIQPISALNICRPAYILNSRHETCVCLAAEVTWLLIYDKDICYDKHNEHENHNHPTIRLALAASF